MTHRLAPPTHAFARHLMARAALVLLAGLAFVACKRAEAVPAPPTPPEQVEAQAPPLGATPEIPEGELPPPEAADLGHVPSAPATGHAGPKAELDQALVAGKQAAKSSPKSSSKPSARPSATPTSAPVANPAPQPAVSAPSPKPTPAPAPKKTVLPKTEHVRYVVDAAMQKLLDNDSRIGPWLARVTPVIDSCYRSLPGSPSGAVQLNVTMHANQRPSVAIKSLPGNLAGLVPCASTKLMNQRSPLFTGPEGERHVVSIQFY